MRALATFEFYRDVYFGTSLGVDAFHRIILRASAEVERLTFGRIGETEEIPDAVRMATCAVCDAIRARTGEDGAETPPIQRERLEQHEVQYAEVAHGTMAQAAYDAAALYLWDTGLLAASVPFREV